MRRWKPQPSIGLWVAQALLLLMIAGAGFVGVYLAAALQGPPAGWRIDLGFYLQLVTLLALLLLAGALLYWIGSAFTLGYELDRNGLYITWLGNRAVVPLEQIQSSDRAAAWRTGAAADPRHPLLPRAGSLDRRPAAAPVLHAAARSLPGGLHHRRGVRDLAGRSRGVRPGSGAAPPPRRHKAAHALVRAEPDVPLCLLERHDGARAAGGRLCVEFASAGAAREPLPLAWPDGRDALRRGRPGFRPAPAPPGAVPATGRVWSQPAEHRAGAGLLPGPAARRAAAPGRLGGRAAALRDRDDHDHPLSHGGGWGCGANHIIQVIDRQ